MSPRRRAFHVPPGVYARLLLYLGLCWGIQAVLVHGEVAGGVWIVAALAIYSTIPLFVFLAFGGWPFYPGRAFRVFVLRSFWYLQLLLPLITVAGVAGLVVGLVLGDALRGGRIAAFTVLALMLVMLVAGYFGSRRLALRRLDVLLPELPPDLEGLRIAQITDLHLGPHIPERATNRVLELVQAAQPDIIAITGDVVDDRPEDVAIFAARFASLAAPLGVYIIAGNHDVYADWSQVERELARLNVGTLLVNESRVVQRGAARLVIVGTGDPAGAQYPAGDRHAAPDLDRALAGVPPGVPVVALAHNPAIWPALAARGVALTLSGHTHWGQFAIPGLGWSLATPFLEHSMGSYCEGESLLYIAPGTGYWGIPFRLGAPSEVTVLTLKRGPRGISQK